jgi:ABC-type dipeptide/oligopeptide/nickel transport system permease component
MNFGPAEMAQTMDAAKALIAVAVVYSVGIGIILGAIVALHRFFRHRAADQSLRSGMPTDPALPTERLCITNRPCP